MNLNKSSSYALIHLLNGATTATLISKQPNMPDIRSVQRALQRLVDMRLIEKHGSSNNPSYSVNFQKLVHVEVPAKIFDDESRPDSQFRFVMINWLHGLTTEQLDNLFYDSSIPNPTEQNRISLKELEYLTVELSWKSSALEGNTYTLLDTQLLLTEGIKAKNRTEFEAQMILNHKDAISFIVKQLDLFAENIRFSTVEELHRIIGNNLGIESGIRKKLVRISASNYIPLSGPHQLREQADTVLGIVSKSRTPFVRALLALTLVPYLQIFEDGNKRTGRLLANALLIASIGRGFSMRKVEARQLAIAYLEFYEFNSFCSLKKVLTREITDSN